MIIHKKEIREDKRMMNGSVINHIYYQNKFIGTITKIPIGKNQWTDEMILGTRNQVIKHLIETHFKRLLKEEIG